MQQHTISGTTSQQNQTNLSGLSTSGAISTQIMAKAVATKNCDRRNGDCDSCN